MEQALKAIAEPRRREILRLVWNKERPAGEIASHFDVSHAAISQHLRVLKETGLVDERRNGRQRFYKARLDSIDALRTELEGFWGTALRKLKQEAEAEQRRKNERKR
ncbi:MAG: metalloregulator ArsR/SmtB family transcription factor [Actinomycetota bacterium]